MFSFSEYCLFSDRVCFRTRFFLQCFFFQRLDSPKMRCFFLQLGVSEREGFKNKMECILKRVGDLL